MLDRFRQRVMQPGNQHPIHEDPQPLMDGERHVHPVGLSFHRLGGGIKGRIGKSLVEVFTQNRVSIGGNVVVRERLSRDGADHLQQNFF